MVEQTPDLGGKNPFQLIAFLLFKVRHSLEDEEGGGSAPRWVRIARARDYQGDSDFIGKGVKTGMDGVAGALSYMLELTLDLRELLTQTDAGKAMFEVTADLIATATSEEFQNGVRSLVGQPAGSDALGGVSDAVNEIKKYVGYIPEPDDIEGLGHELFRLLSIEQIALPKNADGSVNGAMLAKTENKHVLEGSTGKVRLIQWAFDNDLTVYGLGSKDSPESTEAKVSRFGSRRIWEATNDLLPESTVVKRAGDENTETLVEFFFNDSEPTVGKRTQDLEEVYALLDKMGFAAAVTVNDTGTFSSDLTSMLRFFQIINDLPVTSLLDNATINRLMHLDFDNKNIARAKPYDSARITLDPAERDGQFELVNPDADHWEDERLGLSRTPAGYAYYLAGRLPSEAVVDLETKGGWISDDKNAAVQGFVAMQARVINSKATNYSYDGGKFSEGESASGLMFFCARHTEPWKAGRSGRPDPVNKALFGGSKLGLGVLHRMYQWVDDAKIEDLLSEIGTNFKLEIKAKTQIRSLWIDRQWDDVNGKEYGLSDQGRIALELYDSESKVDGFGALRQPANLTDAAGVSNDGVFNGTDRTHSDWLPDRKELKKILGEEGLEEERKRKRLWKSCGTGWLEVPGGTKGIAVILEGKHQSAYDTDAYFDDVKVCFRIRKKV